jgi:hypothetical protein
MPSTTLTPASTMSKVILPSTGSTADVNRSVPYKVYSNTSSGLYDFNFLSGAADQVTYVYRKLGGDILDIELNTANVYSAYEEAVLEYSYILNVHQANNSLSSYLGHTTGAFDHLGQLKSTGDTSLSGALDGDHVALKYPKFDFGYARRTTEAAAAEVGVGRGQTEYSASFDLTAGVQDYDLQKIIFSGSSFAEYADRIGGFRNKLNPNDSTNTAAHPAKNRKLLIKKVFYKTPQAMWRFFGYYGGLNVVGNLHNYGQFSDTSTFELVPAWHNKSQAMAFEDAIYTRMSHWSYELKNNKIRIFPIPPHVEGYASKLWVQFSIPTDPWEEEDPGVSTGIDGINNMNTLPFANLPYKSINSIGKQWIRRFALSLCKEILGHVRSKYATIPIPGESVTLNGSDLISQAKEEQNSLREELKTTLAEMTYSSLVAQDSEIMESTSKIQEKVPLTMYVG